MFDDLYTLWLGIGPGPRPPDHYALLGLERFCQDIEAIESATRARLTRLDEFAMHPDRDTRDAVQDMMNEVARARVCLVNPAKRGAYDQRLGGGPAAPAGAAQAAVAPARPLPPRESVFEQGEPVFARDEPALAGTGPAGRTPEPNATIRAFEALVWKHLGKWKLGPQEERLLVAEAADLSIADAAARRIIRKIDRAAEGRAEKRHNWTVGIVVGSACVVVAGLVVFLLVSNWRVERRQEMETQFSAALASAKDCLARNDLDGAGLALDEAKSLFPEDPRYAAMNGELAAARSMVEKEMAFAAALAAARECIARKDWQAAGQALAKVRNILPDDPRSTALDGEITVVRSSLKLLDEAMSLYATGKYADANSRIAQILAVRPGDPEAIAMKVKIGEYLSQQASSRPRNPMPATQAAMTPAQRGEVHKARDAVKQALAMKPADPESLALQAEIEKYLAQPAASQPATSQPIVPKPGELLLDLGGGVSMKLALIPAGKFMMGSPETEKDRRMAEGPQREVRISKPFYMGVYEVTREQYERLMGKNPSKFKGPRNPVEQVSWDDAVEFCNKLSQKTGREVSLPTEAQWEYACRAGSKTRFGFGDNDAELGDYGWFTENSGDKTHQVGGKKPNALGLYDMHGNVAEWCSDWYGPYGRANDTDPAGPTSGRSHVLRGGSWYRYPPDCRSAHRGGISPGDVLGLTGVGFRVSVGPS